MELTDDITFMKQTIHALTTPLHRRVTIPGSKSITNRAILLAALSNGVSELFDIFINDETRIFIDILHELGVSVMLDEAACSCIVGGDNGVLPKKKASLWLDNATSAARFMLAVCASSPGIYQFDGSEPLRRRPLENFLAILCTQGAKLMPDDATELPFAVLGAEGLQGGEIEVEGTNTAMYVSALLMVAPFAKTPVLIKTQDLKSEPYADLTCAMMSEFGVLVKRMHHARFYVPVPQRYQARDYTIEPDLSLASYIFAAAAITAGEVIIQEVSREHAKQPYAKMFSLLEKMGCQIIESANGLTVKGPAQLSGVNVDVREFPDSFMALAAIAPFATTATTFTNITEFNDGHPDQVSLWQKTFEKLSIKIESGKDWLKIFPGQPQPAKIDCHHDYRIGLACAIMGLRVSGIELAGVESINAVWPDFFSIWEIK